MMAATFLKRSSSFTFICRAVAWLFLLLSHCDGRYPSAVHQSLDRNDTTPNSTVSLECLEAWKTAMANQSFAYIDGMGKPQSGFRLGNFAWLGSYSECMNLTEAQYCLAGVKITIPPGNQSIPIQWGFCAPQSCSEDDITNRLAMIFNWTLNILQLNNKPLFPGFDSADKKYVHCAKPSTYSGGVIATITLCGVILSLCAIGTFWDILTDCMKPHLESAVNKNEGFMPVEQDSVARIGDSSSIPILVNTEKSGWGRKLIKFIQCFSLIKNTSLIMDTTIKPGAITSINGVRVLSMWWVILGHVFIWQLIGGNVSNLAVAIPNLLTRFSFQAIANAFFSVDSFFFLSGLLVSYLSFRQMDRAKGRLPLFKFYFHRFWRLTPTYMFVLLFYAKMTGFLGEGPLWYQEQRNPACDKYWWTNLLYINNFWPKGLQSECMNWSWYLANDMQFYIISPIILLAAGRFGKRGFLITFASLLLGHFITTAVILGHYNLDPLLMGGGENPNVNQGDINFSDLVYIKPYCRIGPYLVGMGLGYLLHLQKGSTRKPHWIVMLVGWCVAIFFALSVVYGPYRAFKKNPVPFTKFENVLYGTFSRFAWGLALAWVTYACHLGFGGLVDKILSASFWIPLSRLTYTAYLVHPIVLFVFFGSFETVLAYSDIHLGFYFAGGVTISYGVAFIVSVCVEVPTLQLEKLIFNRDR